MTDADFYARELKSFLDSEGKLTKYPSKMKPKVISLFYLASKIEAEKRYTEKEINELLNRWHSFEDWAMLRRDLYDRRFLNREPDCSFYWMEPVQPVLEDFGFAL